MTFDISTLTGPIIGGILIGLSASIMMLFSGRIAGISGIFRGVLEPSRGDTQWRIAFVSGLVLGGVALSLFYPQAFPAEFSRSLPLIALGGLLVGFGTRLGSGCTSGHGVCGLGRMSKRSLIATLTFNLTGAATVYLVNHLLGGP